MSYHLAWHQLIVLSMLFDVWAVVALPFLFGEQVFKHNFYTMPHYCGWTTELYNCVTTRPTLLY